MHKPAKHLGCYLSQSCYAHLIFFIHKLAISNFSMIIFRILLYYLIIIMKKLKNYIYILYNEYFDFDLIIHFYNISFFSYPILFITKSNTKLSNSLSLSLLFFPVLKSKS